MSTIIANLLETSASLALAPASVVVVVAVVVVVVVDASMGSCVAAQFEQLMC